MDDYGNGYRGGLDLLSGGDVCWFELFVGCTVVGCGGFGLVFTIGV